MAPYPSMGNGTDVYQNLLSTLASHTCRLATFWATVARLDMVSASLVAHTPLAFCQGLLAAHPLSFCFCSPRQMPIGPPADRLERSTHFLERMGIHVCSRACAGRCQPSGKDRCISMERNLKVQSTSWTRNCVAPNWKPLVFDLLVLLESMAPKSSAATSHRLHQGLDGAREIQA